MFGLCCCEAARVGRRKAQGSCNCSCRTQRYTRRMVRFELDCRLSADSRNRACDTLHPFGDPMWMGYAGRNSETELGRLDWDYPERADRPGHRRLFSSGRLVVVVTDAKQEDLRTSARKRACAELACERLRVLSKIFARDALRAVCSTRSPSAYVSSARQAGPHAHSL